MDPIAVTRFVGAAYAKAGALLGQAVCVYRPDARRSLIPALDSRFATTQTAAWFNPDPRMRQARPAAADVPVTFAAIDPTQIATGDYLMDADQNTWFVGPTRPLLAIPCMRCNRAFTVTRGMPSAGPNAYGGNAASAMTPILTCWPGFILAKPRGISAEARIPGDTKLNVVTISLPVTPGVELLPNDIIIDDQPQPMRYSASLASATDWGWTIEAYYAGA